MMETDPQGRSNVPSPMPHTNHLRLHRRQWALSQTQIADLLGLKARSLVSRYENGRGAPHLRSLLAYQIIFGEPVERLFPQLHQSVTDEVMRRATALDETCRGRSDPASRRQAKLLEAMISRAGDSDVV